MYLFRKFALFIFIILIHVISTQTQSESVPPRRPRATFVTKLSHYLSYDSPFYNASTKLSALDLSLLDLRNSIGTSLYHTDDIEAPLSSTLRGFLAHIKVGSQLTHQFVYMDTGSSLLWINCEPCGYNVPAPIFEPRTSTTFSYEPSCYGTTFTTFCSGTRSISIECAAVGGPCTYEVVYASGGTSKGKLARDSFMFANTNKTLENIGFGCARSTSIYANGVMGLSNNRMSILSQLGATKFGYCIGNISDKAYAHNMLVVGDDIKVMGLITPITVEDKFYLNLVGIKMNEEKTIEFDPAELKRNSAEYTGGMVVDTGSTYTFMPDFVLYQIMEYVEDVMTSYEFERNYGTYYDGYTMLCYDGSVTNAQQLTYLLMEFQFEGRNATMELYFESLFRQVDDKSFCFVMLPSWLKGFPRGSSLMGNFLQQYHYFTYDLANNEASFDRADCNEIIKDLQY